MVQLSQLSKQELSNLNLAQLNPATIQVTWMMT
jgi:hypothetical protein